MRVSAAREFVVREFVDMPKLTPGRRHKAMERTRPIAAALGLNDVVAAIDRALILEERALALAVRWSKSATDHAMHEEGAPEADAQLDRAYSGLYESLMLVVSAFTDHRATLAQSLLDAFFPKGSRPVTQLPYVDQHARVSAVLVQMGKSPHREAIAALHLEDWVARIAEVNTLYGSLLTRPERLTHADVAAADTAGWTATLSVIARVLGAYPDDTEGDIEARRSLLQPLTDQHDEMLLLRARRRGEGLLSEPDGEEDDSEPQDGPEQDAA